MQGQRTGPRVGGKRDRPGWLLTGTWDQNRTYELEKETEKTFQVIMGLLSWLS